MNQIVAYKVTEKLPALVIFELPSARFTVSPNPLQVNSRSVQQVKIIDSFGSTQIIVRLGAELERYTHQALDQPPRVQIDVYNKAEAVPTATPTPQQPRAQPPRNHGVSKK